MLQPRQNKQEPQDSKSISEALDFFGNDKASQDSDLKAEEHIVKKTGRIEAEVEDDGKKKGKKRKHSLGG